MEKWRKRSFPVGIKEDILYGKLADYRILIFYPALKEGPNSIPDKRHAPYPGLVFAHGYMANARDYSYFGKILGSHGYVAVFFSSGVREGGLGIFRGIREFLNNVGKREGLIKVFMDAIAQNSEAITKTTNYLFLNPMDMVNIDRIGIIGHSLGGMTSLKAAAQDKRLKTIVACSAVNIKMIVERLLGGVGETIGEKLMGDSKFASGIKIPTLLIYGSEDKLTPYEHGLSYYSMISETSKEVLSINGPSGTGMLGLKAHNLGLVIPEKFGDEYIPIVSKYIVNWFNFFLYKDQNSWTYLFGRKVHHDLNKKLLSQLKMEAPEIPH